MSHATRTLPPPPVSTPVPLRALLPHEIAARFAFAGVNQKIARLIFAAAVNRFDDTLGSIRGVGKGTLDAVRRASIIDAPEVVGCRRAADGFTKYALRMRDGACVEAVWIPLERPRASLCLSSQVGCPLRCGFCLTGRQGFKRDLAADEIVGQFLRLRAASPRPVSGAVFMGMGEPLLNYDNVIRAAYVLSTPGGGGVSGRAISISTAGVVPAIRRYTAEGHPFRLIVSLSAATPEKRAVLMPHESTWPLGELADAIRAHAQATRARVPVAWVMIRGFNTSPDDATALAKLLKGVPLIVNLIDVNDPDKKLLPPGDAERKAFKVALSSELGQPVVRRYSGGEEIGASCGMLTGKAGTEVTCPSR